jgi:hypothetical protein
MRDSEPYTDHLFESAARRGLLRDWQHDRAAVLCAFDLIELNGKDLRKQPIEERKETDAEKLAALGSERLGCGRAALSEALKGRIREHHTSSQRLRVTIAHRGSAA